MTMLLSWTKMASSLCRSSYSGELVSSWPRRMLV